MRNAAVVLLFIMFLAVAGVARADDIVYIDPATLHIGDGSTGSCPQGCAGDPNIFSASGGLISMFQNQGGALTASTPILLILGVPNTTNPTLFSNSSITSLTSINAFPGGTTVTSPPNTWTFGNGGTDLYGWNGDGYAGSWTGTPNDVYAFLSLIGTDTNSQNWVNWTGAESTIAGITATNFGIYVFTLYATLDDHGLLDIQFDSGAVPLGTIAIGYAQTSKEKCSGNPPTCTTEITVYDTPFTESGFADHHTGVEMPESGKLAALGVGLLGYVFVRRRLA